MAYQTTFNMGKSFALITEGVTDYLVIRELLYNFFKDEPTIRPIQPKADETDKQITDGGWENVINYISQEDLDEILEYNDYIIVQIDSDIAEKKPINISFNNNSNENIYLELENKLKEFISSNIDEENEAKFIFAIGIHTIECWLLAIIDNNHKKDKVINCLDSLNRNISKSKKYKTISKDKGKSKESYIKITNKIKKKRDIIKVSKKNIGFENFIKQLDKI